MSLFLRCVSHSRSVSVLNWIGFVFNEYEPQAFADRCSVPLSVSSNRSTGRVDSIQTASSTRFTTARLSSVLLHFRSDDGTVRQAPEGGKSSHTFTASLVYIERVCQHFVGTSSVMVEVKVDVSNLISISSFKHSVRV